METYKDTTFGPDATATSYVAGEGAENGGSPELTGKPSVVGYEVPSLPVAVPGTQFEHALTQARSEEPTTMPGEPTTPPPARRSLAETWHAGVTTEPGKTSMYQGDPTATGVAVELNSDQPDFIRRILENQGGKGQDLAAQQDAASRGGHMTQPDPETGDARRLDALPHLDEEGASSDEERDDMGSEDDSNGETGQRAEEEDRGDSGVDRSAPPLPPARYLRRQRRKDKKDLKKTQIATGLRTPRTPKAIVIGGSKGAAKSVGLSISYLGGELAGSLANYVLVTMDKSEVEPRYYKDVWYSRWAARANTIARHSLAELRRDALFVAKAGGLALAGAAMGVEMKYNPTAELPVANKLAEVAIYGFSSAHIAHVITAYRPHSKWMRWRVESLQRSGNQVQGVLALEKGARKPKR